MIPHLTWWRSAGRSLSRLVLRNQPGRSISQTWSPGWCRRSSTTPSVRKNLPRSSLPLYLISCFGASAVSVLTTSGHLHLVDHPRASDDLVPAGPSGRSCPPTALATAIGSALPAASIDRGREHLDRATARRSGYHVLSVGTSPGNPSM